MPTAVTDCLKPKFTLVTSSAAIAVITRPQLIVSGSTRHSKISNIRLVRFIYKSFDKNWNYYHRSKNWTFLQWRITFNIEKVVFEILQGIVVT